MKDAEQLVELLKLKGFEKEGILLYKRANTEITVFQDGALFVRISHIRTKEWRKEEVNKLYDFVSSKIYIENFL